MLKRLWDEPATFWALLALPSLPLLAGALRADDLERLLHPTGEFAARFLVITLMLTPLRMLLPGRAWLNWLMRRRRYIGVAAFGYAALHTLYYLIDLGSLNAVLHDATKLGIWTGWVAFLIFVPLAITSTDGWVRRLRRRWKTLHRLVYVSALATAAHWIFIDNDLGPALVHFVPLAALEGWRVWHGFRARSEPVLAG